MGSKGNKVVEPRSARGRARFLLRQAATQGSDGVRASFPSSWIVLLSAFLLLAVVIGCDFVDEFSSTPTPAPHTPAFTPPAAITTPAATESRTSTTGSAKSNTPSASGIVLRVSVGSAPSGLPEYDRGEWRHWTDEDGDCQNARQEVLIAESTIEVTFQSNGRCRVDAGQWEGPYTGEMAGSPGELDVDHLVPLENAHRSGAWAWDRDRKREYANFLGYENHLIATTSSANRSKGSKGPEAWRPPLESYWCTYAIDWVTIKSDWGLTVTGAEYASLSEMLATCAMPVLLQPSQGAAPSMPTVTASPTPPPGMRYDPFGPDRNCGDFDTYEEALAFFLAAGGPGDDPHNLDVNGDGEPCESLPGGPSSRAPPSPDSATALYATFASRPSEDAAGCPPVEQPNATLQTNCNSPSTLSPTPTPEPSPTPTPTPVPTPTPAPTAVPVVTPEPLPTQTPVPSPVPSPSPSPTPSPTPEATAPPPEEAFVDRDCGEFADWQEAQAFYLSEGGPDADPHRLDGDGDGVVCQSLPGVPDDAATPTPAPSPTPTPEPTPVKPAYSDLPFDPDGPDRNCGDFPSWWDAQNFYLAAGGPDEDLHRLDHNGDGIACESLSGAPRDDPGQDDSDTQSSSPQSNTRDEDDFEDRNCGDFDNWQAAQDFFLSEGGPDSDPHRLDHNGDGTACESLSGAPEDDSEEDDLDESPLPSQSTPKSTPAKGMTLKIATVATSTTGRLHRTSSCRKVARILTLIASTTTVTA